MTASVGGSVEEVFVRAGEWLEAGETAATVAVTGVYAPADGTVRGIMAEAGGQRRGRDGALHCAAEQVHGLG